MKFQVKVGEDFDIRSVSIVSLSKDAERAIKTLKPAENRNYEEFLNAMSQPERGLKELRNAQGKWQLQKVTMEEGLMSVRLSQGKRVLFKVKGEDVEIYQVGKNVDTH